MLEQQRQVLEVILPLVIGRDHWNCAVQQLL